MKKMVFALCLAGCLVGCKSKKETKKKTEIKTSPTIVKTSFKYDGKGYLKESILYAAGKDGVLTERSNSYEVSNDSGKKIYDAYFSYENGVESSKETNSYTYDENEEEGLASSSVISVSASALDGDKISTLTITTKATGSTILHISVNGTACTSSIPVTVSPKPAEGTMVAKLNSNPVAGTVEIKNGGFRQFTFAAEDTDGNAYAVAAADVTGEKQSGTAELTISGTRVTANSLGNAVVRYSLNILPSVYVDITLNSIDDYKQTVNAITFHDNLVGTQGGSLNIASVIATKTASMHFGGDAVAIADNELLFSYTNNRATGVAAGSFVYDFAHGEAVDATHKLQTVYVFTTFDESYFGNFNITIAIQASVRMSR